MRISMSSLATTEGQLEQSLKAIIRVPLYEAVAPPAARPHGKRMAQFYFYLAAENIGLSPIIMRGRIGGGSVAAEWPRPGRH
jgi:hypothetical protein